MLIHPHGMACHDDLQSLSHSYGLRNFGIRDSLRPVTHSHGPGHGHGHGHGPWHGHRVTVTVKGYGLGVHPMITQ
jgi:hypothetical protein